MTTQTTKPEYHVVSFSGGKDSTAMVLRMIELGYHIDEVLFCDTTMEFPAMLRHVEKVKKVIEAAGIKFATIRGKHDFEHYLSRVDVPNRKPTSEHYGTPGFGWPSFRIRWCTRYLKLDPMKEHLEHLQETHTVIQYIGIAADEDKRMEKENNQNPNHRHPLRDWGWTEADALAYCKKLGYDWEGLYDLFHRVSCWCCPLSSYDNLRKLRQHFPDLWARLLQMDDSQWQSYTHGFSVHDLDRRFALEDALIEAGESITNKVFHQDHKRMLAGEVSIDDILNERRGKG